MSRVVCNFCAHGNPEGSKFCNECGSPLHLAPCSKCDAINGASDKRCFQCGTPLPVAATAETSVARTASTVASQDAGNPPRATGSVPKTLASPLDELPRSLRAALQRSITPAAAAHSVAAAQAPRPVIVADDRPSSPSRGVRAAAGARRPGLGRGLFLGVVSVAVTAAVYWMSVRQTQMPDERTMAATVPATAPVPATPAVQPQTADALTEAREAAPGNSPSPAASVPSSAESSESSATAPESTPAGTLAGPQAASPSESPAAGHEATAPSADAAADKQPDESPPAPVPSRAEPAQSIVGQKAKTTRENATGDARSAATQTRTATQAGRDAIATQRLIERDLADFPRADSTSAQPSPAPRQ